jgi:hypothetical protein
LLDQLEDEIIWQTDLELPVTNDDAFDAVVCLLAGKDFLQGEVYPPADPDQARQEGWIWVKNHG